MDDGFPVLIENKWHTCNAITDTRAARPRGKLGDACDELLRRLEDENAAMRGSAVELRCAHP